MPNKPLDILAILHQQTQENWLIAQDSLSLLQLTQIKINELENLQTYLSTSPKVLLLETDNIAYLASFLAAMIAQVPVFLGNPQWQKLEQDQVKELLRPNLVWCDSGSLVNQKNYVEKCSPFIGIATGGSSGRVRFALHTPNSLTASVRGFSQYFGQEQLNFCCVLPLHHISGLIQFWRSLITGGKLLIFSYQDLKQGSYPQLDSQDYFISLVPTQLKFLLDNNSAWLAQFQHILLGGAPAWRSLLEKARKEKLAISLTYGMTETASGISFLLPQEFLAGNESSGRVLPHAQVNILNEQGKRLSTNQIGTIQIKAKSLYNGYYPEPSSQTEYFATDDLGFLDSGGYLHILGRSSQKIITGGENVYPQEVEAAIFATSLVKDVVIVGLSDDIWGQAVTAVYVPLDQEITSTKIQKQLQLKLTNYKQPKYWVEVTSLPRNLQGKINYPRLKQLAMEYIQKNRCFKDTSANQ